jgi:pimeloyl-ACP methyl ester carboxylesterase
MAACIPSHPASPDVTAPLDTGPSAPDGDLAAPLDIGPVRTGDETPQVGTFLRVGGRRVHVLDRGRGPPVLLLHGNGGLGQEILSPFARRDGVRWIAPDRPGYGFSQRLPQGQADPAQQARWCARLIVALGLPGVHVVAHSIGSATALCLASAHARRVRSLTLINPFCRPTPHQWKLGLRLATAPVVGSLLRPILPHMMHLARQRVLTRLVAPNPVPPSLRSLPLRHAAQPRAVLSIVAELKAFNQGMLRADPRVGSGIPVVALMGGRDRTAEPDWHGPWLNQRVAGLDLRTQRGVGHLLHHVRPDLAWQAVRDAMARAGAAAEPDRTAAGPEVSAATSCDRSYDVTYASDPRTGHPAG